MRQLVSVKLGMFKVLMVGVTFALSWASGSVAQEEQSLCRYSLSNLEENHCVNTAVKSYQDDFIGFAKSSNENGELSLQDQWDWS